MSSQVAKQGGLVAVDCVVICCCCPCLVLQVTVFLFIRLPHKLAVKSKRIIYILKKLQKRLRKRKHSDDGNVVVVDNGDGTNNCFWLEFNDSPETSQPLQSELQEFTAIQRSRRVLYVGSEQGNHDMDTWIAQEMKFVFDERNNWSEDELAWREMLERGTFWFGSFWGNDDHLECAHEFNGGGLRGGEDTGEEWMHPSCSRNLGSHEILECE